ncbi:MAG: phosphoglycerate kinase [Candidatus Omnitrophica bacterium]|nr:phosphoglycerate kinase [Candidatus Omnitrophota bacterium]
MAKLSIRDIEIKGKTLLMRADFNVPQDKELNITDDTRIRATLTTVRYILDNSVGKLILISHLGRPDGKVVDKYSLKPVAKRLQELLNEPVKFLADCVGEKIKDDVRAAKERIILLENLRFYAEEENNDPEFSKKLASLADFFINDAFGTAHRAHASTEGVAHYIKSAAGLLLEKEIRYLGEAVQNPVRPFMLILGGAKVSDKIGIIENLLPKCDCILVGGGMAYTFLKAQGLAIGNSRLEKDKIGLAKNILDKAKNLNKEIVLPIDHVIVGNIDNDADIKICDREIPDGKMAVDIGPKTVGLFEGKLKGAKTIVWNGPLGIFETDSFSKGTKEIAEFIGNLNCTSIIGGGDTAAAIAKFKLEDKMTHISTGGGASLEFLEGRTLPGIAALTDKK